MAAAVRRSGHARLKGVLMLGDALAAELGVSLPAAMAQLRTVENHIGAPRALSDGRYLEAMASVCPDGAHHLSALDDCWRRQVSAVVRSH